MTRRCRVLFLSSRRFALSSPLSTGRTLRSEAISSMFPDPHKKKYGNTSGTTSNWPIFSSVHILHENNLLNSLSHFCYFLGHPVSKFVPSDVPVEKLALLGAATDWYALSLYIRKAFLITIVGSMAWTKILTHGEHSACCFCVLLINGNRDSQFYMGEFRNLCAKEKMHELQWPQRDYIVQVARFDPAKGNFLFWDLKRWFIWSVW